MLATATLLVTLGLELPSASVEWTANACPGAELELEQAIVAYLRPDAVFVEIAAELGLTDAGPAGLRLELEITSAVGRELHELAAPDCDRVIEQAALLIAGAIDPFAYAWPTREPAAEQHHRPVDVQRPRSPVQDQARSVPEPEPPVIEFGPLVLADSIPPAPDRRRDASISGALSVNATGFVGVFPDLGGGVELEGALERGRLRWQTDASGWFGGRFRSDQADVGADLWALAFSTGVCGVPGRDRIRVPLCGVGGVGLMHAEAVGTIAARQDTEPWAWAGVEARVLFLVREPLAVGLGIGAMATLVRPAWEVSSPGVRFRVPPALGVLKLTFETRALRARRKSPALAIKTP